MTKAQVRNAVIVSGDDRTVLHVYTDQHGASWTDDLESAWLCDAESKVAERIAQKVGGKITLISDLV